MRLLKEDKHGKIKIPLGRVLKAVGEEPRDIGGLVVEKYDDIMEGREIWYVTLPKEGLTEPSGTEGADQ